MATITYSFKIGNDEIPYSENIDITIEKEKYEMSLLSLRYHKKMFQPSKIEASLLLKQKTSGTKKAPDMDQLVAYFKTQKNDVFLSKIIDGNKKSIAENYYVYKVIPEYKRNKDGQYVKVTLHIYSPDHKLTLDKYCRSYVNQKLVDDILMGEINNGILEKAGFKKETVDGSLTHFLNYIHSTKDEKIEIKEFLQPYLVQYNESFYDFIARTANRCGEFFYYENGKLYLGLNDFEEKDDSAFKSRVDINKDKVQSIVYEEADDSLVDTTEIRIDSLNKDQYGTYTNSSYTTSENVSFDDFLEDFFEEDQFTSFADELFPLKWKYLPEILGALFTGGITGAVSFVAGIFIPGLIFASPIADSKNKFMNERWVLDSDSGNGKQKHASEQYDSTNKKATLYGSMLTDDDKKNNYEYALNLNQKFYSFISAGCKEVGRHMIHVDIGTEQVPFLLGQKVTFESKQEVDALEKNKKTGDAAFAFKKYLIHEVSDVIKVEESKTNDEEWTPGQKVVLLPLYAVKSKKFSSSTIEELNLACPPMVRPFIRESGIQRAYVAESNDPNKYGRVCIRYPWQQKSDASSPWIRVAVPYAPNTTGDNCGGFDFQHCEGDEVLVDYEGGNIEHPYVIGSLHNVNVKAPGSNVPFISWSPSNHPKQPVNQQIISSRKGHKLVFDDNGNAEDFLRSCLPALDLIKPLTNSMFSSLRFDQDMNSPLSGGMTLTDRWGVYTIACSTTNRSIDIKSPFGNINLNAFTGITINAPCGDVNIKGKNVTIEAGNELKILSGTNILPEGTSILRDMVLKSIFTSIIDKTVAKLVDLTLVRTTIEVLLKPVTGTMTLKSRRYMLIMAGKGSAEIPNKAYTFKGLINKESIGGSTFTFNGSAKPWRWEMMNDRIMLANTLRLINEQVNAWYGNIAIMYEDVKTKARTFCEDPRQTCKDPETIIKKAYNKMTEGFLANDIQFTNEAPLLDVITEILSKADAISSSLNTLFTYCKSVQKGTLISDTKAYRNYSAQLENFFQKNKFCPLIKDIVDKKEEFLLTQEQVLLFKTPVKRLLAYHLIEEGFVVEQVPEKGKMEVTFNSFRDYKDDAKWYEYVSNIKNFSGLSVKGAAGATLRFGKEVVDYFKNQVDNKFAFGKMYRESGVWSSAQNGEILFSDKNGSETLNFENGGLNHMPNEDGYDKLVRGELASY